MKKFLKKSLSLLLAITIIFSSAYVGLGEVDFDSAFAVEAKAADSKVEAAINWAVGIANDDTYGYSDGSEACGYRSRYGPDYDCSSLVSTAFHNAGFNVACASNTYNMKSRFETAGFTWIPASSIPGFPASCANLERGDILLYEGNISLGTGHTELYLGNGQNVGAHWDWNGVAGGIGGDGPDEINVAGYHNRSNWDGVLRYEGNSFANIGDDFCAAILNTAYWKPITAKHDGFVTLEDEQGAASQLWHFDRQDDGSYVISSAANGYALEMFCGYTNSGNPVAYTQYWGGYYQKWWIYRQDNGYVFVSAHYPEYNLAITLENNSSANGTRITTSTRCDDSSQIWSIYSGDDVQLKAATLNVAVGDSASNTTFTWNDVYGESWYDLKIWKDEFFVGDAYHNEWGAKSGCEVQLPAGTYHAIVDAVNHYNVKMSNVVTFTVPEKTYQVIYDANGGIGAPSSQVKIHGQPLILSNTIPTRANYIFLGWTTTPDATTVKYAPGEEITLNENITLYALWSLDHTHNHDYEIIQPATCTEKGIGKYTCECGDEYTEEISATGHKNTMWITEQEPTCTEDGYKDEWCLDCGELINTEIVAATGHNGDEWIIDVAPTCTTDGSKYKICSACNETVTAVIVSLGHTYSDEWTIDVAPTCTEEGSKSHHCTVCGDKADVTVIEPLGHNYKLVSVAEEHPHTNTFKCSRCTDTKTEASYSDKCGVCNFSYTDVDSATCRITGYIGGKNSFVIPATINGKTVTTTTTGAFKNNTTLTSVKIEDGVQGLGALAFLGCSSLSKVVIPESVTSIGANAFYNCASDFTIYCFRDSYAMQYAIDNSLNYVVMDVGETDNCTIDYTNEIIYVSTDGLTSIEDILYVPADSMVFAEASLISGAKEFLGTGSTVTVFDGNDISSEYTLIVEGDTNGDSVCDALDAAQVALVTNGQKTIDGAYKMAADNNQDDEINIEDYQAIVNKVVA